MHQTDYSSAFRSLRGSIRGLYRRDGFARLAIFLFAWSLATFALDYFLHLPWLIRAFHLLVAVGGAVYLFRTRIAYPLSRELSDDDLALTLEANHPRLADRLISAVQFERSVDGMEFHESADMARALIAEAKAEAANIDYRSVLDPSGVNQRTWIALALAGGLGLMAFLAPQHFGIWVQRDVTLLNASWPQRVYLEIRTPADKSDPTRRSFTYAQGRDVDVLVYALDKGENPGTVWIHYTTSSLGEGRTVRQGMASTSALPRQYAFTFHNLREDLTFWVEGGDDRSEPISIRALVPPSIFEPNLALEFPAYTKLPPRTEQGGDIRAPTGTRARFTAKTNKPVQHGELVIALAGEAEERIRLAVEPDGLQVSADLTVGASTTYTISLTSREDMTNERAATYQILAQPDTPPSVRIREPGRSIRATPVAIVPFSGSVSDDYGIASVEFRWSDVSMRRDRTSAAPVGVEVDEEGEGEAVTESAPDIRTLSLLHVPAESIPEGQTPTTNLSAPLPSREVELVHVLDLRDVRLSEEGGGQRVLRPGDRVFYRFAAADIGPEQEGLSPQYEITVVSEQHLDRELTAEIKELQERIRRSKGEAERVVGSLQELSEGEVSDVGSAQLTRLEAQQGRLSRESRSVRESLAEIQRSKELNRIATTGELENLGSLVRKADNAAVQAKTAEEALARAIGARDDRDRSKGLSDALESEQALISQLDELLKELSEYEDFQSIVRMVRSLRSEQEQLLDDARRTIAGTPEDAPEEEGDSREERQE